MQTIDHAIQIVDGLLDDARESKFSYVAIKAGTVAKILQEETGGANHAMPTCCHALEGRFRFGQDFFRRGKDRSDWSTFICGDETSTFEVLFEIGK